MAKAAKTTEKVEKVTTVEEERITLTLTRPEAETLALLVRVVGGDPGKTRRKHTNAIRDALAARGLNPTIAQATARLVGTTTFSDEASHDKELPLPSFDPMRSLTSYAIFDALSYGYAYPYSSRRLFL